MKSILFVINLLFLFYVSAWCYPILDSKNANFADDCFNINYEEIKDKALLKAILTGKTKISKRISDFCISLNEFVINMDECWIHFVKEFDIYLVSRLNHLERMITLPSEMQELIGAYFCKESNISAISMPVAQLIYQMAYLDKEKLEEIKCLESNADVNSVEYLEKMGQLLKVFFKKDYDTFCEQSLVVF